MPGQLGQSFGSKSFGGFTARIMTSMNLLSSLRPKPWEIEVAHEVVSAVVVSLANTPLTAAQPPLIAARGIHGSLLVALVEEAEVETRAVGGGDGEGSGEEFRSRSAGCASLEEGAADGTRGSASNSMLGEAEVRLRACDTETRRMKKMEVGTFIY